MRNQRPNHGPLMNSRSCSRVIAVVGRMASQGLLQLLPLRLAATSATRVLAVALLCALGTRASLSSLASAMRCSLACVPSRSHARFAGFALAARLRISRLALSGTARSLPNDICTVSTAHTAHSAQRAQRRERTFLQVQFDNHLQASS